MFLERKYLIDNLAIHKIFWFLLIFYPSLIHITGSINTSQIQMHLFFIVFFGIFYSIKKKYTIIRSTMYF